MDADVYKRQLMERAFLCCRYFEGWHSEKHHPYVGWGHKLLPNEKYSARTMMWRLWSISWKKSLTSWVVWTTIRSSSILAWLHKISTIRLFLCLPLIFELIASAGTDNQRIVAQVLTQQAVCHTQHGGTGTFALAGKGCLLYTSYELC